jgi:hypothetical protein
MRAMPLWFCFIFAVAAGVLIWADQMSGFGIGWALLLCNQAHGLCTNSEPLIYATGVMFIAYLVLELLDRQVR